MLAVESPQSFVTRQECDKVAFQNGFRRKLGENEGWVGFSSTTPSRRYFLMVLRC